MYDLQIYTTIYPLVWNAADVETPILPKIADKGKGSQASDRPGYHLNGHIQTRIAVQKLRYGKKTNVSGNNNASQHRRRKDITV